VAKGAAIPGAFGGTARSIRRRGRIRENSLCFPAFDLRNMLRNATLCGFGAIGKPTNLAISNYQHTGYVNCTYKSLVLLEMT